MQYPIVRYQVRNPLLRRYIRFFWELRIGETRLNHKLIPQRNINLRFNLSDTPHYVNHHNNTSMLGEVYFLGLQNQFTDSYLKLNGRVNIMGICFEPYGVYPFFKIPVSEFQNLVLGADEIGFKTAKGIHEQLKEEADIAGRLAILENAMISLLNRYYQVPDHFRCMFEALKLEKSIRVKEFCRLNNLGIRQMERMYAKYVGLPASSYHTLSRFHATCNQLLSAEFSKLSDLAFDNDYFDQMHFIKDFKRYTGNTPRNFINQNNSILQIGKLS